jgi:hypothetical protein
VQQVQHSNCQARFKQFPFYRSVSLLYVSLIYRQTDQTSPVSKRQKPTNQPTNNEGPPTTNYPRGSTQQHKQATQQHSTNTQPNQIIKSIATAPASLHDPPTRVQSKHKRQSDDAQASGDTATPASALDHLGFHRLLYN